VLLVVKKNMTGLGMEEKNKAKKGKNKNKNKNTQKKKSPSPASPWPLKQTYIRSTSTPYFQQYVAANPRAPRRGGLHWSLGWFPARGMAVAALFSREITLLNEF
jgi:hypothetical protein